MIGHVFQISTGKEFLTESHGKPGWLQVCHAWPADQFEITSDTAHKRTLRGMWHTRPNDCFGRIKRQPEKSSESYGFVIISVISPSVIYA
jgi:hypothetical protein